MSELGSDVLYDNYVSTLPGGLEVVMNLTFCTWSTSTLGQQTLRALYIMFRYLIVRFKNKAEVRPPCCGSTTAKDTHWPYGEGGY